MTQSTASAPSRRPLLAALAVAVTILSWASAFPTIRLALHDLPPIPLAAARFATAALAVLLWLATTRPPLPKGGDWLRFALCGLIGIAAYNMLLNSGQRTVSAGAASFIVNSAPILTALLAVAVLKERIRPWGWIGSFLSFGGVGIIASGQPGGLQFSAGAMLVLGAAACSALYFTVQKPMIARYGALTCTAYTLIAGALWLSPWLPQALETLAPAPLAAWGRVLYLGLAPAALGYAAWTYALGTFGAARASNFLYLVPPVATLLAFLWAGEQPTLSTLGGGAVVIAGVILVNRLGR